MDAADHFERLGLPRRYDLDPGQVERNYLARSRAVHPDYHQLASGGEQSASLELSARLNEAYATLRDPFKRAEYLLSLEGGPSASEQKEMPPEFLEEVLELRMEMEDLTGDARVEMERRLEGREAALMGAVAAQFERLPTVGSEHRTGLLRQIRRTLNATKYVRNLLRDLRAE